MKKTITLASLFCAFLLVFVFQAFYPAPFPKDKEQQLLGKANLYNLQFPQEKTIVIADNPLEGHAMRQELVTRFGF